MATENDSTVNALYKIFLRVNENLADLEDVDTAKKNLELDKVGNWAAVQQGGGVDQGTNKIYLGWKGNKLGVTVDSTDVGDVFTTANPPTAAQCGAFPAQGGTVGSEGVRSPALFVNNHTMAANSQGMYMLWNETGGGGEGNIVVNRGTGDGGLRFRGVNTDNTVNEWLVTIDGRGSLNTSGTLNEAGQRVYSPNNPPTSANFGAGWWKDNVTGLIIQTGGASNNSSNIETHNFNISFPNTCVAIVGTLGTNIDLGKVVYLQVVNNSQFNSRTTGHEIGFSWIAIGY